MPSSSGPNIITDGLILSLDAGDRKNSYLPYSTFLNMTSWALGSGGTSGYGQNGNTNENERVNGTDPWGNSAIVWESRPSGDGNADGGWNTDWYSIDRTKLYRFSVWVKRTSSTSGGVSYLGLYGSGGTWGVERLDNGANEGNPYWECNGTGAYTQNVWYLLVGHCYPAGTTGIPGNKHPDTGRYTVDGRNGDLNYCNVGGDVRWLADSTIGLHRTYHFYCGDNTTRLQWFDPRIDLCDGTEPTIGDLLKAPVNTWRDTVSGKKGTLINGTSYSRDNIGTLVFDGTDDYVNIASSADFALGVGDFTIEVMMYPQSFSNYTHMVALPTQGTFALKANVSDGAIYYYDPSFTTYGATPWWTLTLNQWNHVVLVRAGGVAYAYLNGALIGSKTGFTTNMGTQAMNIGWGWGSEFTAKKMSNVKMYNIALTSAEIANNYNEYKTRYSGLPVYVYAEGSNASSFLSNWNNSTTYTMADFGGIPNVNAHGFSSGPVTFTLTLNNLPPHTKVRYKVYWHLVDSLDNETNQLFIMNSSGGETEILRFTKQYNLTPSISIAASPGSYTWSGGKTYTYRPWAGGAYGQDGYIIVDSGVVDHTASTFTARHVMGADQAQADEAEYLSHVTVEFY